MLKKLNKNSDKIDDEEEVEDFGDFDYPNLGLNETLEEEQGEDAVFYEKKKRKSTCDLKMSPKRYYNMRHSLPMRIKYFDQLLELVGLNNDESINNLLQRKSPSPTSTTNPTTNFKLSSFQ